MSGLLSQPITITHLSLYCQSLYCCNTLSHTTHFVLESICGFMSGLLISRPFPRFFSSRNAPTAVTRMKARPRERSRRANCDVVCVVVVVCVLMVQCVQKERKKESSKGSDTKEVGRREEAQVNSVSSQHSAPTAGLHDP